MPDDLKPWPDDWPPYHNTSNEPCSTLVGPCSCGAWHDEEEFTWDGVTLRRNGEMMPMPMPIHSGCVSGSESPCPTCGRPTHSTVNGRCPACSAPVAMLPSSPPPDLSWVRAAVVTSKVLYLLGAGVKPLEVNGCQSYVDIGKIDRVELHRGGGET